MIEPERISTKYNFCSKDKSVLRRLAQKVSEMAARPSEEEKRKLWYAHNDLKPARPVIFCDPENGWKEIVTKDHLKCEGDMARIWEFHFRKEIFWGQYMGDDRVIESCFNIPYLYEESDWGMHGTRIGGADGGSYRWEAPLKDYADLNKLRFPEIKVDYEGTRYLFDTANEIFGDILKVRIKGMWWWTLGLTSTLVDLRGLEQMMYDMYDYPDELHSLMAFLRDGTLSRLDFLEKNNLLSLNCDETYVGSGGFGYTCELPRKDFDGARVSTKDMWGFSESQETGQVSSEMFAEFIFPYQLPLLERFGLNCYGCCEPLNKRWDIVKRIPKLRRVSVSPWANLEDMAEKLQDKYIYSLKPNPSYLAVPNPDEEVIRKSLREAVRVARNCNLEIIMKDNNTIGKNPNNVITWCKIVREEIESA